VILMGNIHNKGTPDRMDHISSSIVTPFSLANPAVTFLLARPSMIDPSRAGVTVQGLKLGR